MPQAQNETQGQDSADEVARDHDVLAIEAVEKHSGDGSGEDRWNSARKHDAAHYKARLGDSQGQAEDGDIVEVIADLADYLAGPGIPVISVLAQQGAKRKHQPRSVR